MKLVLAPLLIFLFPTGDAEVQCGNVEFCNVGFKPYKSANMYSEMRRIAKQISQLTKKGVVGIHKDRDLNLTKLIDYQAQLCLDDTIGYLLDEKVENYEVKCVWTGSSQFGQCRPVPPGKRDEVHRYVSSEVYRGKLEHVRDQLGCRFAQRPFRPHNHQHRNLSNDAVELFVCSERCVQAGIGYVPSLLIIITLAVSFFKNCVEPPP